MSKPSPRYSPPQIMRRARARRAYLAVKKRDKIGREYVGQDEVLVTCGMEAREAERLMLDAARETGAQHTQVRIEAFEGKDRMPYS